MLIAESCSHRYLCDQSIYKQKDLKLHVVRFQDRKDFIRSHGPDDRFPFVIRVVLNIAAMSGLIEIMHILSMRKLQPWRSALSLYFVARNLDRSNKTFLSKESSCQVKDSVRSVLHSSEISKTNSTLHASCIVLSKCSIFRFKLGPAKIVRSPPL